ncbi:MAG: hypothetical protein ABI566_04560 [Pseudolysinimonas sp.]
MAVNRGLNARFGKMFRALVASTLSEHFPDAEARPVAARLSDAFADGVPATDVVGVEGVTIHCRADAQASWSAALDMAENAARFDGNDFGVLIEYRRGAGHDIADSYAVMTLEGWSRLARLALVKEAA